MGYVPQQTGIYKITNPSGKVYIGQSWDIESRFRKYKSVVSLKKQRILYNSMIKYGYINHKIEVIKVFSNDITQKELDDAEIFYIKQYKEQGFSLLNIREGGLGGKLSKESIEKMLITRGKWNHTEEVKLKISNSHKGIGHSLETRNRMSVTRKGRKLSEETKQKLSLSYVNTVPKNLILNTQTGIFYYGIKDAAETINMVPNTLCQKLRGDRKNNTNFIYV